MTLALQTPLDTAGPYAALLARLAAAGPVDTAVTALVDDAATLWSRPGFDTLASVPRLRFTPFPHQLQAAQSALRRMRGRAILADEVGLGKTIEAGLVLSELRLRGLADRALVVVPAGLVEQWQEELDRKFGLPTTVAAGGSWLSSTDRPVVVASLAAARRDPLRAALTEQPWDLVVVDEAHRVKNPRSASGRLARALRARYLLLLTATPVENRLDELFELISLVAPGLLGTPAEFRARHGGGDGQPRDIAGLQARTREVMVRHRRSEVAVQLPQRLAETVRVTAPEQEQSLYDDIVARVRAEGREAPPSRRLALRAVAQLAGSSPAAVAPTLARLGWQDLSQRAGDITATEKSRVLLTLLQRHLAAGEKVVVFTAYRQTLALLEAVLADAGIPTAVYHGALSRADKERAVTAFLDDVPVLLTTEAAGEGRNLQFCHVMVNVDLPWNPMRIEQRLGRLHRIGQQSDVVLTNLVGRGTIEEHILTVLEAKINLFELVVGELDMILGRVQDDFDFEAAVFSSYVEADDDADFDRRVAALGDDLARAREGYLAGRERVDSLVGDPT
ncbi:MAG: DEAD/DEAH box helicase [Mycobacteriales bacterium]